jgi:hypothetical protein
MQAEIVNAIAALVLESLGKKLDIKSIRQRLASIEERLTKLEGGKNVKGDSGN